MDDNLITKIKEGNLAIIPTDTTYGLICDATNVEAVKKVFMTKERDFTKPLIILVSDKEMLSKCVKEVNDLEQKLINKYWPGALSILFLKSDFINDYVTAKSPYVAIRMPDNQKLLNFIKKIGRPIVATSANISGDDILTDVKKVENKLLKKVNLIVDGGVVDSKPSTLVRVVDEKIEILRSGIVAEQIKKDYFKFLK